MATTRSHLRSELEELLQESDEFCSVYQRWLSNRRNVKFQLLLLADELNKHQKNVNIAKVTGTSTSIVGAGLVIGGFAASFFTLGTSLLISAIGAGIGGAGGLTSAGSDLVHLGLIKGIYEKAEQAISRDQKLSEEVKDCLEHLKTKAENLRGKKNKLSIPKKQWFNSTFKTLVNGVGCGLSIKSAIDTASLMRAGKLNNGLAINVDSGVSTVVRDVSRTTGISTVALASARTLNIAAFSLSMLTLPFDVKALVDSSKNLHKGNMSDEETKIRKIVEEMVCPKDDSLDEILRSIFGQIL